MEDKIEKIAADAQYSVGAFDAISGLLAIIVHAQGLDIDDDLITLQEGSQVFHSELEASRMSGFDNTVGHFRSVLRELRIK